MATTFFRVIKYGFLNFWRNGWLTTATIVIMALALLLFQGLILFDVLTTTALNSVQDKIDIAVYFKADTVEDDILNLKRSLDDLTEVKNVAYISKDKALEIFQERHKDDLVIEQALAELTDNPLLASLNIKAKDSNDYPIIAKYLSNQSLSTLVERVTFAQNQTAIERLNKIVDTANRIGLAFTFFIAFIAILVAFNTIRLAIYSNREEIGIMKLVGASNYFAKGPYLVSGILYGIVGAIVALLVSIPVINWISPVFLRIIPEVSLKSYFYTNFSTLLGYLLLAGIGLGIISSWVAIRRYLKV